MGRYSTDPVNNFSSPTQNGRYISSNPYSSIPTYGTPGMPQNGMVPQQNTMADWPTSFPNPMVALDLHGTLIQYIKDINSPSQMNVIPGSLDAVRQLRLKGHKVFILADYPGISIGKQTMQGAEAIHQKLMQLLGLAGCFTIDGLLYNTSNQKQDVFAKPNIGMINRAKSEFKIDFTDGYYVGDSLEDLNMAIKAKLTPVLVLTGNGEQTLKKMSVDLKQKTKVFPDLMSFVETL